MRCWILEIGHHAAQDIATLPQPLRQLPCATLNECYMVFCDGALLTERHHPESGVRAQYSSSIGLYHYYLSK